MTPPQDPLARARRSLDGLSVGDAYGEQFFSGRPASGLSDDAGDPAGPWRWTDDTEQAVCLVECLAEHGKVVQDDLAMRFAKRHMLDPERGYGATVRKLLVNIYAGEPWAEAARRPFDGTGSMGNGSAMRVAPLGAYFADQPLDRVADEAARSAAVTHAHPEGKAGAVAVALAAAFAAGYGGRDARGNPAKRNREIFDLLLSRTPAGPTRDGLERAANLPRSFAVGHAAQELGNGSRVTCPDTVPLCLWLAARHFDDYEAALRETVKAEGDVDTTAAIVGGIVALSDPRPLPPKWLANRGTLPLDLA